MNNQDYKYLLAEQTTVERLLEETPAGDVLERSGLEARLDELREQLFSTSPPHPRSGKGEANIPRASRGRSLAAFEKSEYADDWRELMRLYLVRRTRSFIQDNYAESDPANGRKFLTFPDGTRSYFPARCPKTVKFEIDDKDPHDQYARLYSSPVVDAIDSLTLPRYGLGNYIHERPNEPPTAAQAKIIGDLSRAGKRLMGFCRTNLFKRLESSGQAFLQSVERHVLRNNVYLHALENGQLVPIGTQDASALDARFTDADTDYVIADLPNVVYATKPHAATPGQPEGVLTYVRTAEGNDALAWLDKSGGAVTESQFAILKAAACEPDTASLPRHANHHELVRKAVKLIATEEKAVGGQLGRPSGARFRTYERLKRYAEEIKGTLFDTALLRRAVEDVFNYPLRQVAIDTLNRQLRSGISDEDLASRVIELREEGRLCIINEEDESQEPRVICSLGLRAP